MPITLLVALAGLFAAAVLALGHVLNLPVPCGVSRGCASVAAHPSSRLLGVPIAFFGIAAYLTQIFLLLQVARSRRARIAFVAIAATGTLASAALLLYSQSVIQATCQWCVASGVAMTSLFLLGIPMLRRGQALRPCRPTFALALALLTSAAIGVQAAMMERAANEPPIPAERLVGVTTDELVDPAKSLGPTDAPVTVVMFGDFWCSACRTVHGSLAEYQKANPNGVRLVYRHMPLEGLRGHETSGAAAALSEIAAEEGKFWQFVEAVHHQRRLLTREGWLQLMTDIGILSSDIEARIANGEDPAVSHVRRDVELADRLGITATPTFVVLVTGEPTVSANQRTLLRLLNSPGVLSRLLQARQSATTPR